MEDAGQHDRRDHGQTDRDPGGLAPAEAPRDEQLDELGHALDRTVSSLRGLVAGVRSGGERIGAAASQVLVAAREQAAAASQQSSAVAETSATIEELAATAAQIADTAEFFSFGTNDLTQTTFGLSRDDAGRFLPGYIERGILEDDPFQVLDQRGVGKLITHAVENGRRVRPKLKVGICGEHGGEPRSVKFCHQIGLDYVSCSPFRVPIARLASKVSASVGRRRIQAASRLAGSQLPANTDENPPASCSTASLGNFARIFASWRRMNRSAVATGTTTNVTTNGLVDLAGKVGLGDLDLEPGAGLRNVFQEQYVHRTGRTGRAGRMGTAACEARTPWSR